MELAGFGSQPSVSNAREYKLELKGVDGRPHKMTALECASLDLRILPPVASSTIGCRHQYGIVLGDRCEIEEVEILLAWSSLGK